MRMKPENLIVARLSGGGELVKVLDLGLAKLMPGLSSGLSSDTASLTLAGAVVGTMGYMSPERLLGEEVDDRADTLAVDVLVIESLTGQRPFVGLSFQELLRATLEGPSRIPGDNPAIQGLNAILARCLARERKDRPQIDAVRRELVDAIRHCPTLGVAQPATSEESTLDATRPFY